MNVGKSVLKAPRNHSLAIIVKRGKKGLPELLKSVSQKVEVDVAGTSIT